MGGKNKQSQRTKNNVRPSSSGRSAELLANVSTNFVGFASVSLDTKPMPLAFPLSLDSPDADVVPEFQLVIKKLNKKDPVTKTKALQEMADLVKEKRIEEVVQTLPYWARLYKLLTNDTEHKVRESTQSTHGVIVGKCGRAIAPHLKQIIPTWLTAQYDNYAPAASSAQTSMQVAFPESKLPDVITFCKAEVMAHITTNLVGDIQGSISNSKTLTPEVAEMRQQRMILGTLQGFNFFVKHLPEKHSEWLWNEQKEIFDNKFFWKLASDKCSQIRSAWFGVISRQIERFSQQFAEQYGAKTTKVLVNNLMEKDPLVAMQLWECFLLLTATVKEWYSWVDKKEQLTNRILDLLESGGWGNATHLASIVLPLLANLPQEMLTKDFYTLFFNAMINGLNKKATLASKSHRQAYLTAIGECLKYISVHQIDSFAVEVVTSALRTWLEKILESPYEYQTRTNIIRHSANAMVGLMKNWLKRIGEGDRRYDLLVRNFWQNKQSTITHKIEKLTPDNDEIKRSIDGHILLLQTLNVTFQHDPKKKSLKFAEDATDDANCEISAEVDSKSQETYRHGLNKVIYETCAQYMIMADKYKISQAVFVPLYTLLNDFNTKELFVTIQHSFSQESLYKFYENVLKKWMASDTMRCKEVIHVTFLLLPHMSKEEQEAVFKSFNQSIPAVVEEIISKSLSHPYSSYDYVKQWMRSEVVDATLVSVCRRFVHRGDSQSRNTLLMSFSLDRGGNIIISEAACSGILATLTEALMDIESVYLDVCASLASQLITVLLAEDKSAAYMTLLLQMFKLNATVEANDENMSEDTWQEVKTSWQDGLCALDPEERTDFVERAVTFLKESFLADKDEINSHNVDDVVDLATSLMCNFNENFSFEDNLEDISSIVRILLPDTPTKDVEMHALTHDVLTGRLNFYCGRSSLTDAFLKNIESEGPILPNKKQLNSFVYKGLLRAKYLNTVTFGPQKVIDEGVTETDVDRVLEWSSGVLAHEAVQQLYLEALYDYVILKSLDRAFSCWENHSVISINKEVICKHIRETTNQMSKEIETKYWDTLNVRASREGFFWCEARRHFLEWTNLEAGFRSPLGSRCLVAYRSNNSNERCYFAHEQPFPDSGEVILKSGDNFDIMNASWPKLVRIAATLDQMAAQVADQDATSEADWDRITLAMCSYVQAVNGAKVWWSSPKVVLILHSTFNLLRGLQLFVANLRCTPETSRSSAENARLDEWSDIICVDVIENVYNILSVLLDKPDDLVLGVNHSIVLGSITEVVQDLEWYRLPEDTKKEIPLSNILKACLKTFTVTACQYPVKYLSYYVLKGLRESLRKDDERKYEDYQKTMAASKEGQSDEQVPKPKYSAHSCVKTFAPLGQVTNDQLAVIKLCESTCAVPPFTEYHSVVLSYLLLAEFTLLYCNEQSLQLQQEHIELFGHNNVVAQIMANCLRLLPAQVLSVARADTQQAAAPSPHFADMFTATQKFTVGEPPLSLDIETLACRCLFLALSGVGSTAARGWYGSVGARLSKTIDNVVAAYVTPALVRRQYEMLQEGAAGIPLVTIRSNQSACEFTAEYIMDEKKMELQLKLAHNHPLCVPSVRLLNTPFNNQHFFTKFVAYQNGTILEAIKIWVNMLSKDVDSVSPCYICYNRLHAEDGKLPDKFCSMCKNHYHKHCVFQWFKQSYKATCPICRNPF